MKIFKGTAAYRKDSLLKLLSAFKCLRPPTLFVTLSANDMHWPEVIMCLKGCSYEEACASSNAAELVRSDSYMAIIHYDRRFRDLHTYISGRPMQPLGKTQDYNGRVEFQNRGSPRFHLFF